MGEVTVILGCFWTFNQNSAGTDIVMRTKIILYESYNFGMKTSREKITMKYYSNSFMKESRAVAQGIWKISILYPKSSGVL